MGLHFGADGWGCVLVPVVRFEAPFWCRWFVLGAFWCVLRLDFGADGPFWGFVFTPVARCGVPFWCRWSVLGLHFRAGGLFWGSILVPVVRFGAPFWCRWFVLGLHFGTWWSVLGLHFGDSGAFWGSIFGAGGPFWGSILVPVVRFGALFSRRWLVVVFHFGAGGPFWGSIFVPVVCFGAQFWCRWFVLGLHFGAWCCVLGLHFGAGGSFSGSVLVPVVRFEAPFWSVILGLRFGAFGGAFWDFILVRGGPFWGFILAPVVRFGGSILVPVVRFGVPFSGASFLDLLWLASGGFGFGPPLASGASVLDLLWFWASSGFRALVSGARFWTSSCGFVLGPSRPTISESPYICFKSSNHPLFASLAFVFPFAPPSSRKDALGQDALLLSSPAERSRARHVALAYAELAQGLALLECWEACK